ncbi:50S ribosomal protein L13 [Spirochaetota bacterium]|nr:50S ribosomal protein L13 [Spirochaetota bacterium]
MRTESISSNAIKKEWFLIDAKAVVLGKLASTVASFLRGKHKPSYTPHMDDGDHVIVINARHVRLTGNKALQKVYYHHTGYVGNLKEIPFAEVIKKHPERVIEAAVKGMLPKNKLGRAQYRHLHVYADANHNHQAQTPKPFTIS